MCIRDSPCTQVLLISHSNCVDSRPAPNAAVSAATSHPNVYTPRCTVDATPAAALSVSDATMSVPTRDHMAKANTTK
eukprot:10166166-Lingulodinium_polyedra.AAC.1